MVRARDVDRVAAPEAAVEARRAAGAPPGAEREGAAIRRRQVAGLGPDAATADRAVEREPAVAERVAVLHVVEHDLVEGQRPAGAEGEQVEVDLDRRRVGALNAADDDHDLVEVAVERAVTACAQISQCAERRTHQCPLVVEVGGGEAGIEAEGVLGAVGPAVAVEILADRDLEGVGVDGGVALVEHPDVEPRVGRRGHLGGVVEVLEGSAVEDAGAALTAPAGAEVEAAFIRPVRERSTPAAGHVAAEEAPVRGVAVLEVVDDDARGVRDRQGALAGLSW